MVKRITNTVAGLLKSFDSRTVKILDKIKVGNEYYTIYDNGRVIYENTDIDLKNIIDIDVNISTSFGFCKSDCGIKIYNCVGGKLSIYNANDGQVKKFSLPSQNYAVEPNSVSIVKDVVYCLIGVLADYSDVSLRKDRRNGEYSIYTKNGIDFAIINLTLYNTTNIDPTFINNNIKQLIQNDVFANYSIFDYVVSSDGSITVICKDGKILFANPSATITMIGNNFQYFPQAILNIYSTCDGGDPNFVYPKFISDYKLLKFRDMNFAYLKNNAENFDTHWRRHYRYDSDDNINLILDSIFGEGSILKKTGNYFRSLETAGATLCGDFKSKFYPPASTMGISYWNINYEWLSSDGNCLIIPNGTNGIYIILRDKIYGLNNVSGFPTNAECNFGVFGDDGFLYIALVGKGYIIRNITKDQYNMFTDILTPSFAIVDGNLDTNTQISNIITVENGIWFGASGRHTEYMPSTIIHNCGVFFFNSETGNVSRVLAFGPDLDFYTLRVHYAGDYVVASYRAIGSGVNTIVLFDPINGNEIDRCTTWDILFTITEIIGYKDIYVAVTNNDGCAMYSFRIVNGIYTPFDLNSNQLNYLYQISNNYVFKTSLSQIVNKKPYISDMINIGNCFISTMFVCEDTVRVTIFDTFKNVYSKDLLVPVNVCKETRLRLTNNGTIVTLEVINCKNSDDFLSWTFNIENIDIANGFAEDLHFKVNRNPIYLGNIDYKLISDVTSRFEVAVSEGFVIGDSGVSDFGRIQSNSNNAYGGPGTYYSRSSLSFGIFSGDGYGPTDGYRDRCNGDIINGRFPDLINLKPGYTLKTFIGFGRGDCRLYIAQDSNSDLRFIREYITNNRDIIDINVTNIPDMNLLGTPLPGSTVYDNVSWHIGDINDSAVGIRIQQEPTYGDQYISQIVYLGTKKQFVVDVSSLNLIYPAGDWFTGLLIFDDVDGDVKLYNNWFGSRVLRLTESGLSLIDIFGRTLTQPIDFYTSQKALTPFTDRVMNKVINIVTLFDKDYHVNISKYIKGRNNFNINKLNGNLSLRSRVDLLNYNYNLTPGVSGVQSRFVDGWFICNLSNIYEGTTVPVIGLASINLDRFNNLANIDKLRFYIEFDDKYDDDFLIPNSQNILLNCIRAGDYITRTNAPLVFTQDPTNENVYYTEINMLTSNIITGNSIYIDTVLVGTTVNVKFRVWSDAIFYGTFHRDYFNTSDTSGTMVPIDGSVDKRINVQTGYSSNDIIIPMTTTGPAEPYITLDNELTFKLNPYYRYGPNDYQAMLELRVIPDVNIWLTYDTYSFIKIGNIEVKGQIIDTSHYVIAIVNTDTGVVYSESLRYGSILPGNQLSFALGITNYDDDVYYGKFYYNGVYINDFSFNVNKGVNESVKILSRYFGEISNINWAYNTVEPVSNVGNPPVISNPSEIGDNALGQITCFVRDFKSGKVKAYVSPTSEGSLKDSGLIGYIIDGAVAYINDKIDNVPNDLKCGQVGYSENAAFKLITFREENDPQITLYEESPVTEYCREQGFVSNIFKRTTVEQIPIFGSEDIVAMTGEPLVRESDGIVIETSDYVL